MSHHTESLEIYTDGSSLGNPGRGGWGVVVVSNNKILTEIGGCEDHTTNNRMELQAVIEALKFAQSKHPTMNLIIHADSAYALGGVTTWIHGWEKNGWKTSTKKEVLNQDLWKELIGLVRGVKSNITWQKVKGHAGHEYNERADLIATECSSLQRKYNL